MTNSNHGAPAILALDVGTSSARAMPFDRAGAPLMHAEARRQYAVSAGPDGRATLDPEALLNAAVDVLGDTAARLGGHSKSIVGVGLSVFMHGLIGVGADGAPTTSILMWSDTRSAEEASCIAQELGRQRVLDRTGCPVHSSFAPAKLLWLKRHDRRAYEETRWWMPAGDYLTFRLFGEASASLSMASSLGLVEVSSGVWDEELLGYLGLDEARLPPLREFDVPFEGVASASWRDRLGVAADVPWTPANADGACSNVGSGATSRDKCALNVGTSAAMRVLDRALVRRVSDGLWCYLTNDNTPYIGAALSNAGNLLDWVRAHLAVPSADRLEAELLAMEPDAHGLTVLPFLFGERGVGWNPEATGAIVGLRASTTAAEIARAGLETVGIRLRMILDRIGHSVPDLAMVVAGGGGLRSRAWAQIITDALAVPTWTTAVPEASARGAAIFALHALGEIPDVGALPPETTLLCEPDANRARRYEAAAERHAELYAKLVGEPCL